MTTPTTTKKYGKLEAFDFVMFTATTCFLVSLFIVATISQQEAVFMLIIASVSSFALLAIVRGVRIVKHLFFKNK